MVMFIILMIIYEFKGSSFQPNIYLLLFPILVVLMALLGLGTGMIISALTTKYRDLSFLVTFGVQLLMYATTVVYPLTAAPSKYKWIINANPMTAIIETLRFGFLGHGSFSWSSLGISTFSTLVITIFGIIIFNKVERNFIDTV